MVGVVKKPYAYAGLAVVGVVGWALATAGSAIAAGHPSYWVAYGGVAMAGMAALVLAVVWRSRPTRPWLAVPAALGLVGFAGLAWWLAPFEATNRALDAMESDDLVVVASSSSQITMTPTSLPANTGVIFQPGARVDARAYANILRPIAEAGHQVVIVKQPLGVGFLASGFAASWAEEHPEIGRWVVAGHSLGGVVAAQNAAEPNATNDLVLWASYPSSDISNEAFAAVSVFGTNDGLTTIAQIEESVDDLPPGTGFVEVEGAIHSYFGDYGAQPGDGEPGVARNVAQDRIVSATLAFLDD